MNFSNLLKAIERVIKEPFGLIEISKSGIRSEKLTSAIISLNVSQIPQNPKTANKGNFESVKSNDSNQTIQSI